MKRFLSEHKLLVCAAIVLVLSAIVLFAYRLPESNLIEEDALVINQDSSIASGVTIENECISFDSKDVAGEFDSDNLVIYAELPKLKWGVYNVHVEYDAKYVNSGENSSIGFVALAGGNSGSAFGDAVYLYDYKNVNDTPFWETRITGEDNMYVQVYFTHDGTAVISSIVVSEYTPFKLGLWLIELLILAVVCLWYYKIRLWDTKAKLSLYGCICLVIFASFPAFAGNNTAFVGQDYPYHISRMAGIANELKVGHFPVMYDSNALDGVGYVFQAMYGDALLYVCAMMHLLGMPLVNAYNAYVVIVNILTCAIAWYAFKKIFTKDVYALIGTGTYMLAAYRLCNLYVRGAVGEYTAMAFMPLAFYGFYKIYFEVEKAKFKDTIPLIIAMTGIVESHVLTAEMMAQFVFLFVLVHFKKTIKNLLVLVEALATIVALNLYFFVPFMSVYRQGLIVNSDTVSNNLQKGGVFLYQLLSPFMTENGFNVKDSSVGEMPLTIGIVLVMALVGFIYVIIKRNEWGLLLKKESSFAISIEMFVYGLLALWFSSYYFPWDEIGGRSVGLLKMVTAMQFPWRYLTMGTMFFSFLLVFVVKTLAENDMQLYKASLIALAIGSVFMAGEFMKDYTYVTGQDRTFSITANTKADNLYLPYGIEISQLYNRVPRVDVDGAAVVTKAGSDARNRRLYQVKEVNSDCMVTFPVIYYGFLSAYDVTTGEPFDVIQGYNYQATVRLQKGYTGTISIGYGTPFAWGISFVISLMTLIALCCYGIIVIFRVRVQEN